MFTIYIRAKIYTQSYNESFIVSNETRIREHFWMGAILFFYILKK